MADGGAVAGADRCLSDLSDDLLRRIIFLATDKEGASTAVLSRRWRWLWRTSGAVYLDSHSFNGGSSSPDQDREGILRAAEKALATAAANCPIRRLTLRMAEDSLVETLVSNKAALRVEELKIFASRISFGCLPSEALRVLSLIGCHTLKAPPPESAAVFPMLVELHLVHCDIYLVDFRKIINSAPWLSTLHLKSSTLCVETDYYYYYDSNGDDGVGDDSDGEQLSNDEQPYTVDDDGNLFGRLFIPAVTTLEVADCTYGYKGILELDVPRLQYFTYRGHVGTINLLSLIKSQASCNMIQVDLDLTSDKHCSSIENPAPIRDSFRQFILRFRTTKLLKIKLDFIEDHLALDEDNACPDELLGGFSFDLLNKLQLETEYTPQFERPLMVMLANLLHSCPVVHDLRLILKKQHEMYWVHSSIDKEAGVHFDRSVNGFRNRNRPMVSLGGDDDDTYYQTFSTIPSLTGEHPCLQSHLKRVSLKFFMDEPNCLGVQLAKFFADNAMVLQEIHIDDGCHEMLEHVNPTVRRWIAKTDKGSKQLIVKD